MVDISLGINNSFAVNRWLEPSAWMEIIHSDLELDTCVISTDILDPLLREPTKSCYMQEILDNCDDYKIQIHSIVSGISKSVSSLMLHPDLGHRINAIQWFENLIDIAAGINAYSFGGFIGYINQNTILNEESTTYYFQFLADALIYLARTASSAGLEELIIEPIQLQNRIEDEPKVSLKLLEMVDRFNGIPVNCCLRSSTQISRLNDFKEGLPDEWFYLLQNRISTIYINYNEISNVSELIEKLDDNGINKCNLILEINPPLELSSSEVISRLRDSTVIIRNQL